LRRGLPDRSDRGRRNRDHRIAVCGTWHVEEHGEQGADRLRALLDGPLPAVAMVQSTVRP